MLRYSTAARAGILPHRWNAKKGWCTLCRVTCDVWWKHVAMRDHQCLELVLDSVMQHDARVWIPYQLYKGIGLITRAPMLSTCGTFSAVELERRHRLVATLVQLRSLGVLDDIITSRIYHTSQIGIHRAGYLVSLLVGRLLLNLFPRATVGHLSNFHQMTVASFNIETVFDLCGLRDISAPIVDEMQDRKRRKKQTAATETPLVAIPKEGTKGPIRPIVGGMSHKTTLFKALIGILWDVTSLSSTRPDVALHASYATWALIGELVIIKTIEYVQRAESVWESLERDTGPTRYYLRQPIGSAFATHLREVCSSPPAHTVNNKI